MPLLEMSKSFFICTSWFFEWVSMLPAGGDSKFLMGLYKVQGLFHGIREFLSYWILEWSSPHLSLARGSVSAWAPEWAFIPFWAAPHWGGCGGFGSLSDSWKKLLCRRQGKCSRSDVQSRTGFSLRVPSWSSLWSSCLWRTPIPAGSCAAFQSNKVHMHLTNPSSAPFANQNKLFPCLPGF